MKKKEFALGILCGAMLFSGATAAAVSITAEPTWQGCQTHKQLFTAGKNRYKRKGNRRRGKDLPKMSKAFSARFSRLPPLRI